MTYRSMMWQVLCTKKVQISTQIGDQYVWFPTLLANHISPKTEKSYKKPDIVLLQAIFTAVCFVLPKNRYWFLLLFSSFPCLLTTVVKHLQLYESSICLWSNSYQFWKFYAQTAPQAAFISSTISIWLPTTVIIYLKQLESHLKAEESLLCLHQWVIDIGIWTECTIKRHKGMVKQSYVEKQHYRW